MSLTLKIHLENCFQFIKKNDDKSKRDKRCVTLHALLILVNINDMPNISKRKRQATSAVFFALLFFRKEGFQKNENFFFRKKTIHHLF